MSTWGQIRTNIFTKLLEVPGATFSEAEVDQFMLREYEHQQTVISQEDDGFFAKTVYFDLKADDGTDASRSYGFPEDFNKILQIETLIDGRYVPSTFVPWISREQFTEGNLSPAFMRPQIGSNYTYSNNCYRILPFSQSAVSRGGRLTYVPSLGLGTDIESPLTPKLYHELIELGSVNRARAAMKEPPIDKQYYDEKFESMINTISPRVKGRPRYVRMTDGMY